MMPRTLACFFLAMAVLMAALVLPRQPIRPDREIALDIGDAVVVEVRLQDSVFIEVGSRSNASYDERKDGRRLLARRVGDRIVLEAEDLPEDAALARAGWWLRLPQTVEVLHVDAANVRSETRVRQLDIHAAGRLDWQGNAGILRVFDARTPAVPKDPAVAPTTAGHYAPDCGDECDVQVSIDVGGIDRLEVSLQRGGVELERPQQVGEAHLKLGPRAWVSLGRTRHFDNIHIQTDPEAP